MTYILDDTLPTDIGHTRTFEATIGEPLSEINERQASLEYEALRAQTAREQATQFVVKDSGKREEFDSGMRRDTEDGKPDFTLIRRGPMFRRWAEHLTKGAVKYGRHNWTKANSMEELERFQRSAARHFEQWLDGDRDEDHAAAVMFNLNAAEYVRENAF